MELTGESADRQIYADDLNLSQNFKHSGDNRDSISHIVRSMFTEIRDQNKSEPCANDLDEIYNPHNIELTRLDWTADDPVFRQLKLDLEWFLEEENSVKEKKGYTEVFTGDARFWQALDNSNDPSNIQKVQLAIGDRISDLNETSLSLNHNAELYHYYSQLKYPIQTKLDK